MPWFAYVCKGCGWGKRNGGVVGTAGVLGILTPAEHCGFGGDVLTACFAIEGH